jgi:hypothetical protein
MENNESLEAVASEQDLFVQACKKASSLKIADNFAAAFTAAQVVVLLDSALTDKVVADTFMPLMNIKAGFLTDKSGKPDKDGKIYPVYSVDIVKSCLKDAIMAGLLPTGNQFNIIAGRMYPTKEGYSYLLKKIKCKYITTIGLDKNSNPNFAEIPCSVAYEWNGEKSSFSMTAVIQKRASDSMSNLRGKAEKSIKHKLYEYLTGVEYGDADNTEEGSYEDVTPGRQNVIPQSEPLVSGTVKIKI